MVTVRTATVRRMGARALRLAVMTVPLGTSACTEVPRTYSSRAAGGEVIFRDAFDEPTLSAEWNVTHGEGVRVENGLLKLSGVQNRPVWLRRPLPDEFRIEFDAWATTEEGDIKVEVAGDGESVAKSLNYVATGYVIIFGGWDNSLHAICRKREHGRDRQTASEPKVEPGRRYHFTVTRSGGELRWDVDGAELLVFEDPQPLRGDGQDHFAFSGWEAETHFDNLVIEAL